MVARRPWPVDARAILTHGRSEMKPVRNLRRSAGLSRALSQASFADVDKRPDLSQPLRSSGCGSAGGSAEWRA
jgi:hypothetical protein